MKAKQRNEVIAAVKRWTGRDIDHSDVRRVAAGIITESHPISQMIQVAINEVKKKRRKK